MILRDTVLHLGAVISFLLLVLGGVGIMFGAKGGWNLVLAGALTALGASFLAVVLG